MPSDLWRYSINAIKSDVNISKLRDYQAKEVKKTIRKKLLTVGTEVFVICNKKMLKKFILETPGLSNVYQKLPFLHVHCTLTVCTMRKKMYVI